MGLKYTSVLHTWTPIAHADSASALANGSYHAIRNGAAGDVFRPKRIVVTGEAVAAAVNSMAVRRNSTNGATPTNVAPGPLSPNAAAASAQQYSAATTGPTIAATRHLLGVGINTFGGGFGMQVTPDDEPLFITVTAPNAELNLDSVTGTGLVTSDVEFEAL